jgi:hypothetical protein
LAGSGRQSSPPKQTSGASHAIDCEFLAADRWQVEGKRHIVCHGGCGAPLVHGAPDTKLAINR